MGDSVDELVKQLEAEQLAKQAESVESKETDFVDDKTGGNEGDESSENTEPEVISEEENEGTIEKTENSEDELLDSIANAKEEPANLETLPKNVQKKINRDNAARKQAEEELARANEELARLRMQNTAPQSSPANISDDFELDESLPVAEQFKILREREKRQEKVDQEISRESERINRLTQIAAGKAEKARAIFDDYDEVAGPVVSQFDNKPHLLLAIPQCENMGKVMYYLGKNPAYTAELLKIADPVEAAMKIGKLDAKLSQKPETKKVSTAPKPMEKVGSTAGHGPKSPPVLQMKGKDFDAYLKTLK